MSEELIAKRIYQELREVGYIGSYDSIKKYAKQFKKNNTDNITPGLFLSESSGVFYSSIISKG